MMQRSFTVNDPDEIALVESYRVLSYDERELLLDMAVITANDRVKQDRPKLFIVPSTKDGSRKKGVK